MLPVGLWEFRCGTKGSDVHAHACVYEQALVISQLSQDCFVLWSVTVRLQDKSSRRRLARVRVCVTSAMDYSSLPTSTRQLGACFCFSLYRSVHEP